MTPSETAVRGEEAQVPRGRQRLVRRHPGTVRRVDVRVFSSASDAPRARRPTDIVLLVLSLLGVLLLAIPAPGPTALDHALTSLLKDVPGLFGWLWETSYDLLLGWALLLLGLALFSRRRKRLLLDELLAGAIGFGGALAAGNAAGTDWSTSLKAVTASTSPPVYLAVRLAIATAIVVTASPHMGRPLRYVGRWVIAIGALAGIALGVTYPIGVVAGFLIGIGSAAFVHLLLGSPGGRLTPAQVIAALDDLGVEATDLREATLQLRGVALMIGSTPDGRSLAVKTYGRDAWDGQLLASLWSSVWNRGTTPSVGFGRLQQVEHEAFVTLLAERAGIPVLPIVAAGMAAGRDALLVSETTGAPFGSLDRDGIDDDLLEGFWRAVERLHDLGLAHGRLDGYRLVVRPDGLPALGDLGDAKVAATTSEMMSDRAQLLVTTALTVGHERAVSTAVAAIGNDGLAEVLPFLQPAVLDRETRHAVREREWDLDDLRKLGAQVSGVEPPQLEQIRRVSLRSVLIVALIAFLAYALISAIAGIGLQNLIDELKQADPVWLLAALLLTPFVQVGQAFSTMGASIKDVRFGPVLMLEYAIQFIALAVPSSAARVAVEVRFFERNGVDAGAAVSIGVIDSVCGFVIQMLLIVIITISGLSSLTLSSFSTSSSSSSSGGSSSGSLIVLALVLLVLGGIVALAIPRYRAMIREALPRYRASLQEQLSASAGALRALRSPVKLLMIFGGNLYAQLLLAIILGLCLHAFGQQASLAGLILVNTFVSLFAGFMPVPGGMGVAEAGYTAGLVALGIPNTVAVSTALAFRLVTFYLPPTWGTFGMRWLRRHSYV